MKKKNDNGSALSTALLGSAAIVFVCSGILFSVLNSLDVLTYGASDIILISVLLAIVLAPAVYGFYRVAGIGFGVEPTEDMSALTVTDKLTHVMNRRGITMGVLEAMAQAERYNTPLSIATVDIDHFQRVNDELGKEAGDKVLADLAGVLADTLRMPDKVGRYGGEEFLVVLPHTSLTQARKIAERVCSAVGNSKLGNGKRVNLTVSVGVTQYTKGADLEHLLTRANAAVQEAKRDGGNRVVARKNR